MRTLAARRLTQRVLGGSALYASVVLADEPVFYYRLEELSGPTVADETGNGNHGAAIATLGVAGRVGLAASFDGTDDYLTAVPVGDLSALAVECWAKIPNGVGGGTDNTHIWGVVDAGSSNIIQLVVNSNGTLALRERTTASGIPGASTTANAWDDGEWHHIVALLQAGSLRQLWIDGAIEATGTATSGSWTLTSTPLTFGGQSSRGTPGTFVECTLDEIAFYDKLLTGPRIVAHYQAA